MSPSFANSLDVTSSSFRFSDKFIFNVRHQQSVQEKCRFQRAFLSKFEFAPSPFLFVLKIFVYTVPTGTVLITIALGCAAARSTAPKLPRAIRAGPKQGAKKWGVNSRNRPDKLPDDHHQFPSPPRLDLPWWRAAASAPRHRAPWILIVSQAVLFFVWKTGEQPKERSTNAEKVEKG